ncbi:MAG: sigma-70 family RNA polymerase sigma factor [Planctomycetia bacterium]|nr:sigma-70 family RNA polymerase sigma factor [Planctomycetia bacterium]
MAKGRLADVFGYVRGLFAEPRADDQADSTLLRRFLDRNDEAAFGILVNRHGPLVMRVCRQVLGNQEDAEDAFQATFLVLARKAANVRQGEALAGWLYRVAYHIAVQARSRSAKRQVHEKEVAAMRKEETVNLSDWDDVWPVLHDEVNRLPAKLRTPVVLCYLNGKTNEEAADQLNWPVGTVKTRLSQGRDMLRERLSRRGVVIPFGLLGAALLAESQATAVVPASLVAATVRAATLASAGQAAAAAGVSAPVAALADQAVATLFLGKLKALAASAALTVGVLTGGVAVWSHQQQSADQPQVAAKGRPNAVPIAKHSGTQSSAVPFGTLPETASPSRIDSQSSPAFGSTVSVYPPVGTPPAQPNVPSSREAGHDQPPRPTREQEYHALVEEEKQRQAEAARQAKLEAEAKARPKPPPVERPSGWWDWLWLPW